MKKILITLTALALVVGFIGCRKVYEASQLELTAYAWEQYESGDYLTSYTWFHETLITDSLYQDGYNGLGWSIGKLSDLDSSIFYLEAGLNLEQPKDVSANVRHELWAGLTFACQADGQDSLALLYGDSLLGAISDVVNFETATWIFSHDENINHLDVGLAMATAHFNRGQFGRTLDRVQSILLEITPDSSFTADTTTVIGRQSIADQLEILRGQLAAP